MSQSTNTSVINFCDVCNLSFETKKGLYRHQSYDTKHKELLEKMFESDEELIREPASQIAGHDQGSMEKVLIRMKMIIFLNIGLIQRLKLKLKLKMKLNHSGFVVISFKIRFVYKPI